MKKIISLILLVCLWCTVCVSAGALVIGEVLHTDIVAYINGMSIPSYNIAGWTGIVAEDLRAYGFDVNWFPDERALYVTYWHNPNREITASYVPEPNQYPVGSHAMDVYQTDIKTYVNGEEVTAFNVDGRTIIYIDWLQCYGDVVWDEAARTISYTDVLPWSERLYEMNAQADTSENIGSFRLAAVKNEAGGFTGGGDNLDYLTYPDLSYTKAKGHCFSFSLYQRVLFQTDALHELLRQMLTVDYTNGETIRTPDFANAHMKIVINGEPVQIRAVEQGRGNGHVDYYFYLDCNLSLAEIQSVSVTCS